MKAAALAFGCLIWLCASPARPSDLDEPVPGHPGLVYLDLIRLVVIDLGPLGKDGAVGRKVVPFAHIDGEDAKIEPPDPINLQSVEAMAIPGDESRIITLADLGSSEGQVGDAELLALFALSPAPKLLDVVEVGTDSFTGFSDAKGGMLASRTPLILIYSTHGNSNQSYLSTKMMFVRGDRLQLIDGIFTFSDEYCSYARKQEPSFATLPGPGPYRAVRVVVRETVAATGAQCNDEKKAPRPHASVYQATYRWDAQRERFATQSKELDRLAAEGAKRF